jgi:hypothetical protein
MVPTLMGATLAGGIVSLALPLATGPVLLAALLLMIVQFINDGAASVGQIAARSLRQAVTPHGLLGRTNACFHLLSVGVAPPWAR